VWADHSHFQQSVKTVRGQSANGCKICQVVSKLKALKKSLKQQHRTDINHISGGSK